MIMLFKMGIFLFVVLLCIGVSTYSFVEEMYSPKLYLDKSLPYIGADIPKSMGYDGSGIKIAIIDTGVDHRHPDLFSSNDSNKIEGINFVNGMIAHEDLNGHGTQVAGIIAADGNLKGISPKSKIISYKVSDDGESVSSELIIKAIRQAIADKVDIINISLGVNKTNSQIDKAVNDAVSAGIVVVVAAGNDGPLKESIGSPGINYNAITVGATYNNLTSSLVATLEIDRQLFQIIPMVGTEKLDQIITSDIVFGEYGRTRDFVVNGTENENTANNNDRLFEGKIVLVERGSDVKEEIVYFSDKEFNAANAGAIGLIVYNNEEGIFLGELLHEFVDEKYQPRIPTVSISREEGLQIKSMIEGNGSVQAKMNVFYNPDFVAHFSSRGPVSPFYLKPDLVAPGVFVNSTMLHGGYNYTSGTSFAAPHVSGTAALLLQKNPDLTPQEIKSILITTTDLITDSYRENFSVDEAGSGRLNATRAFEADMIILPPSLTFDITQAKIIDQETLKIKSIDNKDIKDITVDIVGPENFEFKHEIINDEIIITVKKINKELGRYEGRIFITYMDITYNVPFIVVVTQSSISTLENVDDGLGVLSFDIDVPSKEWSFAKISVVHPKTGEIDYISYTPQNKDKLRVYDTGTYWITAKITTDGETYPAYDKIDIVQSAQKNHNIIESIKENILQRHLIIIFGIIILVVIVGIKFEKNQEHKVV
jgi:minor extracellular serine protease Vpr